MLSVTELSFKENLCCVIIGSVSLYANFIVKTVMPSHFAVSRLGIEIGSVRIPFRRGVGKSEEDAAPVEIELPHL